MRDWRLLATLMKESRPNFYKSNDPIATGRRVQWRRDVLKIVQAIEYAGVRGFDRAEFLHLAGFKRSHIKTLVNAAEWNLPYDKQQQLTA